MSGFASTIMKWNKQSFSRQYEVYAPERAELASFRVVIWLRSRLIVHHVSITTVSAFYGIFRKYKKLQTI